LDKALREFFGVTIDKDLDLELAAGISPAESIDSPFFSGLSRHASTHLCYSGDFHYPVLFLLMGEIAERAGSCSALRCHSAWYPLRQSQVKKNPTFPCFFKLTRKAIVDKLTSTF
jgi:hypothetical protein